MNTDNKTMPISQFNCHHDRFMANIN